MKSDTGRLKPIQNNMREYLEQTAKLGWLMDPVLRTVQIFRPGGAPETRTNIDSLQGEGPLDSFVLDLTSVWDPFAG